MGLDRRWGGIKIPPLVSEIMPFRAKPRNLFFAPTRHARIDLVVDREARDKLASLLESALNRSITAEDIVEDDEDVAGTRDSAVNSILAYLLPLSDRWLSESDCGEWSICNEDCRSCSGFGRRSDERRNSQAKAAVARAVRFLRTDQVYEWDGIRLTWWMVPIIVPLFLAGAILCIALGASLAEALQRMGLDVNPGMGMFSIALPFAILFLLFCEKLSPKSREMDKRYWPFANREKCEAAGPTTA